MAFVARRVDRAILDLERLLATLKHEQRDDELSIARLHSLGLQLLTYVRSMRKSAVFLPRPSHLGKQMTTSFSDDYSLM